MKEFEDNIEQFRDQLESKFGLPRRIWGQWNVEITRPNYVLIHLCSANIEPGSVTPVVWSKKDGTVSVWMAEANSRALFIELLTAETLKGKRELIRSLQDAFVLQKFTQFIQEERLTLAENLEDILGVFWFAQIKRRFVESMDYLQEIFHDPQQIASFSKHEGKIAPPVCSLSDGEQRASFWAFDFEFGNLEEWLFIQKGYSLSAQHWTREHVGESLIG